MAESQAFDEPYVWLGQVFEFVDFLAVIKHKQSIVIVPRQSERNKKPFLAAAVRSQDPKLQEFQTRPELVGVWWDKPFHRDTYQR